MKKRFLVSALALSCAAFVASSARADVKLNPLFSDNMVVQRGLPIPIYGTARPGEAVRVLAGFRAANAVADASGNWQAQLPARQVGPAFEITVQGDNRIVLKNVVAGDVWLCGGQSNMEWPVAASDDAAQEIASANHPDIRFFPIPHETADAPRTTANGGPWHVVSPQTVPGMTAVGYFFAREVQQKTGVPIGLLQSYWGGALAEAWTSREGLRAVPELAHLADRFYPANADVAKLLAAEQARAAQRMNRLPLSAPAKNTARWSQPGFNDRAWKAIQAPGLWETAANLKIDGAVWMRREVNIPENWANRDLSLSLGPIDDLDLTYFNGAQVGATGTETPAPSAAPRLYTVPARLVKAGRNVIAVRVLDNWGSGGFGGKPEQMTLSVADDTTSAISLVGTWRYAVEYSRPEVATPNIDLVYLTGLQNRSTVLYNAKIAPLTRSPIRGALWYQGESNAGRAFQYRALLPAMIRDWRNKWRATGSGDFPFYIVELANFTARAAQPGEDAWAELREAQQMTAQTVPNSGIATAIDIGDAADIHPRNKQEVGRRLALIALAKNYGQTNMESSGPRYQRMKIVGDEIHLDFSHAAGLRLKNGEPAFAIAGKDRKFHWAQARIIGQSVVVSSPEVKNPVAARYAWAINPNTPLVNFVELPALPFRTDNWPGITVNNK